LHGGRDRVAAGDKCAPERGMNRREGHDWETFRMEQARRALFEWRAHVAKNVVIFHA
jgi:hypothetical protein